MGKSGSASCFKFVGCGDPDSVDRDDLPASELEQIKDSSDKRKWSFRKRPTTHRVLSNSVISETSLVNKTSLDTPTVDFQKQPTCTNTGLKLAETISLAALEKTAEDVSSDEFITVEKNAADSTPDEFSVMEKSTAEVTPDEFNVVEKIEEDVTLDVPSVIIIQTAIRGFLDQKELVKNKATIMLQASIRGHIVRKTAVGSLRCFQAIVKMQVLIRERRAHLLLEGSRFDENDRKLIKQDSKAMEKLGNKPLVTYTPIEELLLNSFARQLLESNLKSKTINIKCEPLKSDSAWKWMEKWMSIYSTKSNNSPCHEYTTENLDDKSVTTCLEDHYDDVSDSFPDHRTESGYMELDSATNASEMECKPCIESSFPSIMEPDSLKNQSDVGTTCLENRHDDESDYLPDQAKESSFVSNKESDSFTKPSEMEYEDQLSCVSITGPNSLTNQSDVGTTCLEENRYDDVSDSLPDLAKESSFDSNKECDSFTNPSETEYKEQSSCASIMDLTNQSNSSETTGKKGMFGSRRSSNSAFIAAQSKFEELSLAANSVKPLGLSKQDANVVGSESVTELSVSSKLDSLHENTIDLKNETILLEDKDEFQKNHTNSIVDNEVDSLIIMEDKNESFALEKPDSDESEEVKVQIQTKISHPPPPSTLLSPQASPKSHVAIQDSQETPSSHVSSKSKKSVPNRKQKSISSGNGGYKSDTYHDLEQLSSIDKKSGKRRNSFGSASNDNGNQEQRENNNNNNNNSIPSYMQATESAKAKAIANNSPRSSPDTLGKEFYIKKRHSLPGVHTKNGSPQTQTLKDAKTNGVHSPQERKWRR